MSIKRRINKVANKVEAKVDLEKNKAKIKERFESSKKDAEKILKDPQKTEEMLNDARKKIDKLGAGPVKEAIDDLFLLIGVVKSWIKGEYRDISVGTIIAILGAIIYFVSPVDIFPDVIPGIGYIDDFFVVSLVMKQVHSDLIKFKVWKEQQAPE